MTHRKTAKKKTAKAKTTKKRATKKAPTKSPKLPSTKAKAAINKAIKEEATAERDISKTVTITMSLGAYSALASLLFDHAGENAIRSKTFDFGECTPKQFASRAADMADLQEATFKKMADVAKLSSEKKLK